MLFLDNSLRTLWKARHDRPEATIGGGRGEKNPMVDLTGVRRC